MILPVTPAMAPPRLSRPLFGIKKEFQGVESDIPDAVVQSAQAVKLVTRLTTMLMVENERVLGWLKKQQGKFFKGVTELVSDPLARNVSNGVCLSLPAQGGDRFLSVAHGVKKSSLHYLGETAVMGDALHLGTATRLQKMERGRDLALLATNTADHPALTLAQEEPDTGDTVYVVGLHPRLATAQDNLCFIPLRVKETNFRQKPPNENIGIQSSFYVPNATFYIGTSDTMKNNMANWLDARGLSGAPVVNAKGELVGIISYVMREKELGIVDLKTIRKFLGQD